MGTGFDHSFHQDERGIIPRAVEYLFQKISEIQEKEKEKGATSPEFKVNAQFMEVNIFMFYWDQVKYSQKKIIDYKVYTFSYFINYGLKRNYLNSLMSLMVTKLLDNDSV